MNYNNVKLLILPETACTESASVLFLNPVDMVFAASISQSHRASCCRSVALLAMFLFVLTGSIAHAQRPLRLYDPFYRDETARRTFFDRYALSAEVSYRPAGFIQGNGDLPSPNADPLAVSVRFDYELSKMFNLGFLIDAVGGTAGRQLTVNWVTLKYFRTVDTRDYAFRLAVDPSADGQVGFPQMDLAFLYTSLVTPALSTDFGIGVRRVRIGFQQFIRLDSPPPDPLDPLVTSQPPAQDVIRTRALGWEIHAMTTYNILFDPAGSSLFVTLLGEAGRYDLIALGSVRSEAADVSAGGPSRTRFQGGVVWARTGIKLERPGFQLAPYLAVPMGQWTPSEGRWPSSRLHVGVRFMIR